MEALLLPFYSVLDDIASAKEKILNQKKINDDERCKISNIELQLEKLEDEYNKLITDKLPTLIKKTDALFKFERNTNETVKFSKQECTNLRKTLYNEENKSKEDKKKYDEILSIGKTKWKEYEMIYSEFPVVKQHQEQLALLKLTNFNMMLMKQCVLERKEELRTMENITSKQLQLEIIQIAELFVSGIKLCRENAMVIRDTRKLQDEVQKMNIEKEKLENKSSTNAVHTVEESTDLEMVNAPRNVLQEILASLEALKNKQHFSFLRRAIPELDYIPSRKLPRLSKELFHDNILTSALNKSAMEIEHLPMSLNKENNSSSINSETVFTQHDKGLLGVAPSIMQNASSDALTTSTTNEEESDKSQDRSSTGTDDNADYTLMETTTHIQTQESETTHQAEDNDLSSCRPSTTVPDAAFINLLKSVEFQYIPRKLVSNSSTKSKTSLDCSSSCYFQPSYRANVLSNNSTAQLSDPSTSNNSNKEWQHLGISSHTTDSTQNINPINKHGNFEPDKNQNVGPTRITQETSIPMQTSTYNIIENNTNLMAEDYQTPVSKPPALIYNDAFESSYSDFPKESEDSIFSGETSSDAYTTSSENGFPFKCNLSPIPTLAPLSGGGNQPAGYKESSSKTAEPPQDSRAPTRQQSSHKTAEPFFDFEPTSGPSNIFKLF